MRSAHQHAQDVNNSAPRWLIIVMLVALVVGVALLLRPERLSGTLKQFPTFSERAPSIGSFRGATKDPLLQRDAKREPSKPVSPPSPVPSKPSDTPKSPAPASKTTGSVLTSDGVDLASLTLQQAIERYSRIHQEQLDAFARDGSGRFVIIWPFGGLGNRLLPSITGFLLSLLTDRALLVNWKPRESSKPLGEMFDMKYFNWDLQSFPAILQRFDEPYCKSNPPDVDYIGEGDDIFSPSREMYSCKDFRTLWRKQVVSQTACQYILPLLLANEHIQAVLEAWGIQAAAPGDTFGRLAEYLLQPAKPIADVVESFMSRKFTAATVIGAQVRMKNIGVKDGTPTQMATTLRLVDDLMSKIPDSIIYLATDSSEVRAEFTAKYGAATVVFNDAPIEEFAKEMNQHHGWTDLQLLSNCDVVITSSMSSYGYLARAFRGLEQSANTDVHPLWMVRDDKFYEVPTAQPCLHFADYKANYQLQGASCVRDRGGLQSVPEQLRWSVTVPGQYC